jgi:hypothetical protein
VADDVVTDLEIAVLCDLLDGPGVNLKAHKRSVLDALVSKGLVGPDVRDDVSLSHHATCFPHCILSRANLAGADVAVVDLIPVVDEPRHFAHVGLGP